MCISVFVHTYAIHRHTWCPEARRVSPLELELYRWLAISCHVGAGTQTLFLSQNSRRP